MGDQLRRFLVEHVLFARIVLYYKLLTLPVLSSACGVHQAALKRTVTKGRFEDYPEFKGSCGVTNGPGPDEKIADAVLVCGAEARAYTPVL